MSKHTPGPWTVTFRFDKRVAYIQDSRSRWDVCAVPQYDPADECEANVRLIAAAPSAVSLLAWIREELHEHAVDVRDGIDGPAPNWAMQLTTAIDELLRKAGVE